MDLLGRKANRTRQALVKRVADLEAELRAERNKTEFLARALRDTDQEIFNMSQRTSWEGMRPHFRKLQEEMLVRKNAESKRIAELLRPELIETYVNPEQKKLTHG